jgi:hypothetical protein
VIVREGGEGGKRTVGDGGHETIYGDGSVEDHLGRHGLLAHKVAAQKGKVVVSEPVSGLSRERESVLTDLRTRASEVRPAIAMPTWSSMRNIFC